MHMILILIVYIIYAHLWPASPCTQTACISYGE